MSHKKNASLIWVNTFVVYVTHISCIVSSSNWIKSGFNHMNRHGVLPYMGQKPLRLKQFLLWQGLTLRICFNVSFLDFN